MFQSLSRSWGFAMTSYRILWDHKHLLILPLLSTFAGALVGNFSLGLVGLLILLPIYLVGVALIVLGVLSGSIAIAAACGALGAALFVLAAATSSSANTIFTAVLYNFATGRSVPAGIDDSEFAQAFLPKQAQ